MTAGGPPDTPEQDRTKAGRASAAGPGASDPAHTAEAPADSAGQATASGPGPADGGSVPAAGHGKEASRRAGTPSPLGPRASSAARSAGPTSSTASGLSADAAQERPGADADERAASGAGEEDRPETDGVVAGARDERQTDKEPPGVAAKRLDAEAATVRREAEKVAAASMEARAADLYERVEARQVALDDKAQHELASLVTLMPDVLASGEPQMLSLLEMGTGALLRDPPEPALAKHISENLRIRLLNPVRYVVAGMALAFVVLVLVPFAYLLVNPPPRALATSDRVLVQAVRDIRDLQAALAAARGPEAVVGPSPSPVSTPGVVTSPSPTATSAAVASGSASVPARSPSAVLSPGATSTTSLEATPPSIPLATAVPSSSPPPEPVAPADPVDPAAAVAIGALLSQPPTPEEKCPREECFLGLPIELIALVAVFGAAGALASIFVRIRTFASIRGRSPVEMFLVGFTRPILGILFALFIFTVISAGLVPLLVEEPSFFWATVAFVAGFSERLAPDVANRTEATILAANPTADASSTRDG